MASNKPLTTEEKVEIVDLLRRGNLSHRAIARQFNRSQSTISALARDAGISPTHRRTRTPAAKDIEGSFGGHERTNLVDFVLGIIRETVGGGGLNPRELKDITQALKLALEARRAEDFPEVEENKGARNEAKEPLVDVGMGDLKLPRSWVEQVDKDLEQQKEAMLNLEPGAFPSYGVNPEHDPPWMVEAYHKMLAKKRAEANGIE